MKFAPQISLLLNLYIFGHIHLYFGQVQSLTFLGVNFWSSSNVKIHHFRSNSNQFSVILIGSSELTSSREVKFY